MDGYDRLAEIMKALGHPVRLQIIEELGRADACVCHLEHFLGQRQAYISQQLARLRTAGLVTDQREGMNVYYSLADPSISLLLDEARRMLDASGDQPYTFHLPEPKSPCPCPKCQQRLIHIQEGINHEQQTS
jgi:DNA-binding transcriptional ArsR family regulator